eukprot:CAMPEP_0172791640 /NCGR_PEP_ID=MMETSP1074-20121228/208570_1 /TAXON_ID=2916 /ORGANISM="Ceratium fusus, Strain PA161109" /LENGTH=60 /DNA_ID=CAMNT_0013628699 /DNA_START=947 /DNA_END=1126 /DNA_ORIENTATION=-
MSANSRCWLSSTACGSEYFSDCAHSSKSSSVAPQRSKSEANFPAIVVRVHLAASAKGGAD